MLETVKLIIFVMMSLVFAFMAIAIAEKESKEYVLNGKEKGIVLFISTMFCVWLVLCNWNASNWYALMLLNVCFSVLAVSFYIDIKLQELPDRITLIVMIATILILLQPTVMAYGWGVFSSRFVLATLITGASFVFSIKTENLGMGDVKLLFPMLLLIGTSKIIVYLYNVLVPAFIVGIIVLLVKKDKGLKIAFGPFLILGFVLSFSIFPTLFFM